MSLPNIEVMHIDGCPNATILLAYLNGRHDITVLSTLIAANGPTPTEFAGSPTVLIDGRNPFGGELVGAPACALHAPTISQIDSHLSHISDLPV